MVGVPFASALTLAALFLAGIVLAIAVWLLAGRPRPQGLDGQAVAVALIVAVASIPYVGWRVVEDLRYTTGLNAYDRSAAGPIQAFLPGYLVDDVRRIIPPGETYATKVGPAVPYPVARKAFPALALVSLFPRTSAPPDTADWLIAWGTSPSAGRPTGPVVVAHARQGPLPPVLVARALK